MLIKRKIILKYKINFKHVQYERDRPCVVKEILWIKVGIDGENSIYGKRKKKITLFLRLLLKLMFPNWNLIPKGFLSQLNTNSDAQLCSMIESGG